jgi:predicted lipoprotein with Yx(FWY)xxD motif
MNPKNHTKTAAAALVLGAALLLSGCADTTTPGQSPAATSPDTGGGYEAPAPSASDTAMAGTDLKTAQTSLGNIVVDAKGISLYVFTKDAKGTKTSACTGECLNAWPIATTANATPTMDGVTGEVGTITSPDGQKQLTLNGMPLYYFSQDTKPGDTLGQAVQGIWYVLTPEGEMVK